MTRQYVIAYDIADDRRRNAVFKTLYGYGDHMQFSVFFCELTETDLIRLRTSLRGLIHHTEDQVIIADLGPASRPASEGIEALGKPYQPTVRTLVV